MQSMSIVHTPVWIQVFKIWKFNGRQVILTNCKALGDCAEHHDNCNVLMDPF